MGLARARVGNLDLRATIVRVVRILLLLVLPPRIKQGFSFEHFGGSPGHLLVHILLEAQLAAREVVIDDGGRQRLLLSLPVRSNRFPFTLHNLRRAQFQAGIRNLLYAVR